MEGSEEAGELPWKEVEDAGVLPWKEALRHGSNHGRKSKRQGSYHGRKLGGMGATMGVGAVMEIAAGRNVDAVSDIYGR